MTANIILIVIHKRLELFWIDVSNEKKNHIESSSIFYNCLYKCKTNDFEMVLFFSNRKQPWAILRKWRRGNIYRPPRSLDLSPLDYFARGYLKNKVHQNNPTNLTQLKQNIKSEMAVISIAMCKGVSPIFVSLSQLVHVILLMSSNSQWCHKISMNSLKRKRLEDL